MKNLFLMIILLLTLFLTTVLTAQENCLNDPSCRHTKSMMLEATKGWDSLYVGINTNKRSDTIDVLHYTVNLNMTDFAGQQIKGSCAVRFVPKMNQVNHLALDLLQLKVDSVLLKQTKLSYSYNDTLLDIQFGNLMSIGDTAEVVVYYKGVPQQDKDWGGFYYKDAYAYNLGVGFVSNPHNYGRVWHPCFDNFAERATYTFNILTKNNKRAHCNGYLQSETIENGLITRVWQMKDAIPTYLACISVGEYTTIYQEHQGINGAVPIELAAATDDTANLQKSFKNLKNAIAAYEYWYGAHRWNKVGYSLVPFRSGAMEHATNITYPISAANGTLYREHLMVHELGHSWWGNLVTCETASDMWINEGMASYSEDLFWEYTYGRERYIEDVKNNHYSVLLTAHEQEGGYRPISGVPHDYTYGAHVYDKGASVVHNMRWYLGDSLFRKGLHYIIDNYQFKNLNTAGYRDAMTTATGVDMNAFFDDWVFRGGFPHFEVKSSQLIPKKEGYKIKVLMEQKLVGRDIYFQKVPLLLTFLDDNWNKKQEKIWVSGALDSVTVSLDFIPTSILINEEHQLNQARFDAQLKIVDSTSLKTNWTDVGFQDFVIKTMKDSAWLQVEKHPVLPTVNQLPSNCKTLVGNAFWTVGGIVPNNLDAEASLTLETKEKISGDSVLLLYRPNPNEPWQEHPNYVFWGDNNYLFSVLKGDYTFAKSATKSSSKMGKIVVFNLFEVLQKEETICLSLTTATTQKATVGLYNQQGEKLLEKAATLSSKCTTIKMPIDENEKGIYFIKIKDSKGRILKTQKWVSN